MTIKCVICGSIKSVFKWPSNADKSDKWTSIAKSYHPNVTIKKSSGICYKHFSKEDFSNFDAYYEKSKAKGEDVR